MSSVPPCLYTLVSAELFFILFRSNDIKIFAKRHQERNEREQHRVTRGLRTALLLECIMFVPASAFLLLLIAPLFVPPALAPERRDAVNALLGVLSYGFPFGTVRALVTRLALNTLKEFATIAGSGGEDEIV